MNSPIDSRQLNAFTSLARLGSFTQAAKELFLSQSAVSHSMRALETDVGCRLFDRIGKKVFLTQAGETLQMHAEKILGEMQLARRNLQHLGKWGKVRLRIGASSTACQHIIPEVLLEFRKHYPDCAIEIEPGDAMHVIDGLMTHRIDLAIGMEIQSEHPLIFHHLFHDELKFITAPEHAWAIQKQVNRENLNKQHFILYDRNSLTSRLIEDYFREEKIVLHTFIELGSMEAIKELVKVNLGVAILAPWIARKEIQTGSLVPHSIGRRKLKRNWGILHWKEKRLGLPEETFITICRNVTAQLLTPDSP